MSLEQLHPIRIISVTEMEWNGVNATISGRPFHALTFRICGDGTLTEGGKNEPLKSGALVYMPQGVGYHAAYRSERVCAVHFEAEHCKEAHMHVCHPRNAAVLQEKFAALLLAWEQKRQGYMLESLSLLYGILYEMVRVEDSAASADHRKIYPAVTYLHTHFADPALRIEELCHLAAMSDTYFRRLFVRQYGCTPLRYLNQLRIEHAKALLYESDCTVSEVAERSGFVDPKYFSTVFRRHTGRSPTVYRQR